MMTTDVRSAIVPEAAERGGELAGARAVLDLLFGPVARRKFAVRFWTGAVDAPPFAGATPAFTLVLPRPDSLRRLLLPPSELRLGEAFIRGDVDVDGDLVEAVAIADVVRARLARPATLLRIARLLEWRPWLRSRHEDGDPLAVARRPVGRARVEPRHSVRRDSAAVRAHYDVGNDFYALWLDREMVYSCAYFQSPRADIDAAQRAKLEHVCRKLRLRPGERLLDIGCGWGALVRHAVLRHGVRALGVTLSEMQARLANRRIAEAGIADRCAVKVCDYRELDPGRPFDKIVSVGMVEHVGRAKLPRYFAQAWSLLAPGGLFLNHGIVQAPRGRPAGLRARLGRAAWRGGQFIDRYVFPDGELPTLVEVMDAAARAGFETRDVENLREHYVLTLRRWVERLERAGSAAVAMVGEPTYRVWRLYMAASARAFATARQGLAQVLLAKPDDRGTVALPLTRADLYHLC